MEMRSLGLGDLLVIASEVLGIEATVLAKAANLVTGDSALHAPAAEFAERNGLMWMWRRFDEDDVVTRVWSRGDRRIDVGE